MAAAAFVAATLISAYVGYRGQQAQASAQRAQADFARQQANAQARTEVLRMQQIEVEAEGQRISALDQQVRRRRAAALAQRRAAATAASHGLLLSGSPTYGAILEDSQRSLYEDLRMLRLGVAEITQREATGLLGSTEAQQQALRAGEYGYQSGMAAAEASQYQAWGTLAGGVSSSIIGYNQLA